MEIPLFFIYLLALTTQTLLLDKHILHLTFKRRLIEISSRMNRILKESKVEIPTSHFFPLRYCSPVSRCGCVGVLMESSS